MEIDICPEVVAEVAAPVCPLLKQALVAQRCVSRFLDEFVPATIPPGPTAALWASRKILYWLRARSLVLVLGVRQAGLCARTSRERSSTTYGRDKRGRPPTLVISRQCAGPRMGGRRLQLGPLPEG